MYALKKNCSDSIIEISDGSLNLSIITVSDDASIVNVSSDASVITISDTSVISISDTSVSECQSIITVSDGSETYPSFDFETSTKLLLPQPRTSTPSLQREAAEAAAKAKIRKFRKKKLSSYGACVYCSLFSFL